MSVATGAVVPYESQLKANFMWGINQGGLHFEHDSEVFRALRKIARRLDEIGVPYAVAGGMALFAHGYERFTTDVDILVTSEGLRTIHERLEGLGYVPPFAGSKHLRDTENGVRIEFLVAGQFPGDGKPKPVAFPDPAAVSVDIGGVQVLGLTTLIELKLASGMTNPGRMKDLGDIQELIRTIALPAEIADQLDPTVRDKYLELWQALRDAPPDIH